MDRFLQHLWIYLYFLFILVAEAFATASASPTCGACIMVVTELERNIAKAGNKKMERIIRNPLDANIKSVKSVKSGEILDEVLLYKRSEMYVSDVLDHICDLSAEWTTVVHPTTGKGVYARRASLVLKQIPGHPTIYQMTEACNDFLDIYEDELTKYAHKEHKEPVREFCHEKIKVCTAVDVIPLPKDSNSEGSENPQPGAVPEQFKDMQGAPKMKMMPPMNEL